MAYFSSMSGLLPAVVLVLVVLTGTGSGGQGAAAESNLTPGIPGSWAEEGDAGGRVWAARGANVLLKCRLEGTTDDWQNVTWLRNNMSVLDRRHLVTPDGHLNITKMIHRRSGVSDEGEYRCLVTTSSGILTGPPITLRVASLTKNFVLTPSNVTVVVGEALRLSCQIDSQPPASFTWTHDQQPLPQDDRYTTPFSGVLHITEVQRTDSGIYRCLATNSVAGKERRSSAISVTVLDRGEEDSYKPPTFLSPKKALRVIQGENAIIECLANGVPPPTISWQRKLNVSEVEGWEDIKNGTKGISVIGQGTLVLSNVQNTSVGCYACTVKSVNPATEREATVSQEIELDVMVPPEIINPPKPLDTLLAKTARLNCSAMGHPIPRIIWYKNGRPVIIKGRTIQTSTQLIFTNSITSDTGMYQCLAINDAGYASSWAPMVINSSKNHPDPPQNLHSVVLSSTSVILTWDPVYPPGDKIKAYSIHYFESESNGFERQAVSQNASHLLENLKPNTKYTAFVRAYSNFPSDQSDSLVFRTAEDVPLAAPSVRLIPVSPTVLRVTWGKLSPEQARGTIIGYKILWRKPNHHYYHVNEVSADVQEYEISELTPGKRYEVQVLAGTKVGYPTRNDLPWIPQKMANRNQKNIPLPPVVTLKVINDTSEDELKKLAIKIDWKLPSENTAELEGYTLRYRRQDRPWLGPINLPPTQTSYTITGLDAEWYEVQVKAFNADGDGGSTEQMVHTFPPSPNTTLPPNITWNIYQLEADPQSQTSIHLSWRLMEGQEGAAYYTVKYRQITLSPNSAEAAFVCSEMPETVITGLKPFSTYEFSVRAHESEKVYGPFSPPVQAVTTGNLPTPPEDFAYVPTDASTIRLMWNTPEDRSGKVLKYEILFSLDKSKPLSKWEVQEVDGKAATDTVGGLVSNTKYWFRIRGCTILGCGATTEPMDAIIPAILSPDQSLSTQNLYIISGLVAFLLLLIILVAIYLCKFRNTSSQPRVLACNGNGHINGKRNTQGMNTGPPDGQSDIEGQEMEVYIPMLTQIPPDFKSPPLDTKGGYPDSRVNGLNNPRCNGYIRNRDQLQPGLRAEVQGGSEEEHERLVIGASSSNGSMNRNAVPQARQNHHQEVGEPVGGRNKSSHSPVGTPPLSPVHQHNHSGASQEGLTNLTSLTTLSVTDSEGGMEQDRTVVGGTGHHRLNTPHQHNQQHHNTGATRASSPQPPLTTVQ